VRAVPTISATSTEPEIRAAYLDACGYEEAGSVAMAKRFVTVLRAMQMRGITAVEQEGQKLEYDLATLRAQEQAALRFIAECATGAGGEAPRIIHADLRHFRR